MFIGGSAGSTTGSIKVVRHLLVGKLLRRELDQTVHPELVSSIRLNRARVDERTLRAVIVFVLLYVGLFALGAFAILARLGARRASAVRPIDAIAHVGRRCSGTWAPRFGFAGPMGSFDPFGTGSKVI